MTDPEPIGPDDNARRRLGGWFAERFPVLMLVFGLPSFLAANLVGQISFQEAGTPQVTLGAAQVLGWLCAVGFLLCVRIFDEHKDYADDVRLHPGRILSRGVVTLGELRAINAANIAVMVLYCLWMDGGIGPVTVTWLIAFGWLLLMRREFFVADWLRPRLVLYALSHAVVTPLVTWWMVTTGTGSLERNRVMVPYAVAAYSSSLLFEFARKMLPPGRERPDVATYTSVLGPRTAAQLAAGFAMLHVAAMAGVLLLVRRGVDALVLIVGLIVMGILAAVTALGFAHFGSVPSDETHKPLEPLAGLTMLVPSLVVITGIVVAADVTWGWT